MPRFANLLVIALILNKVHPSHLIFMSNRSRLNFCTINILFDRRLFTVQREEAIFPWKWLQRLCFDVGRSAFSKDTTSGQLERLQKFLRIVYVLQLYWPFT